MKEEALYANALNTISLVGPKRLSMFRSYFGSFASAWRANERLVRDACKDAELSATICKARNIIDPEAAYASLEKYHISIILRDEPSYPQMLNHIAVPPEILYMRGKLPDINASFGIVGTRKPTPYGIEAAEYFSSGISTYGIPIISGLARGIDTIAHTACLDVHGTTVAILGSGLADPVIYPAINKRLLHRIVECGGAAISEYACEMKAQPWTFPQRNRIIAGLSTGLLVVEAQEKSGALITASYAVESGKDVFAVPGSIFSSASRGPHQLITLGATPATDIADILPLFGIEKSTLQKNTTSSSEEQIILDMLSSPQHADHISRTLNIHTTHTQELLSLLEIRGMIKHIGQGIYRKTHI